MRRLAALLVLAGSAAAAQPVPPPSGAPPPPPAQTCVPTALLERLVANAARQPWGDVAQLMDEVRQASRGFTPCLGPPPPAARPAQ